MEELINETIKKAEAGDTKSQLFLGLIYYNKGSIVNRKQSAIWVKKAIENGNKTASIFWEEYQLVEYE